MKNHQFLLGVFLLWFHFLPSNLSKLKWLFQAVDVVILVVAVVFLCRGCYCVVLAPCPRALLMFWHLFCSNKDIRSDPNGSGAVEQGFEMKITMHALMKASLKLT